MPTDMTTAVLAELKRLKLVATPGIVSIDPKICNRVQNSYREMSSDKSPFWIAQFLAFHHTDDEQYEANAKLCAGLWNNADALIRATEERDRQALDIRSLQELAEHLELENSRLQEKLQEARDLNKGQQDARILEDENRVLDEKTAALQAEVDRLNIMLAVLSEAEEDTKRIDWIARSYGDTPHDAHRRLREDIDVMRRKEQQEMTYE